MKNKGNKNKGSKAYIFKVVYIFVVFKDKEYSFAIKKDFYNYGRNKEASPMINIIRSDFVNAVCKKSYYKEYQVNQYHNYTENVITLAYLGGPPVIIYYVLNVAVKNNDSKEKEKE
jgi:hypothetical protein